MTIDNSSKKRVIITGASGFIGKHLVSTLLASNYRLVCLDLNFDENFNDCYETKVDHYKGDIQDINFIEPILLKYSPDYIIHLAGLKNRENSIAEFDMSMKVNYFGTLNILTIAKDIKNLKRIVLIGTAEEYGNIDEVFTENGKVDPSSAYGLSKLSSSILGKIFYKQFGMPLVVLRPSIAYGPGQGPEMFIPALIETLINNKPFDMTAGAQYRNFIYVLDLIHAIELALICDQCNGEIINIGARNSEKLKDVAVYIASQLQKEHLLNIGAIPYRKSELMDYRIDINKASEVLNWAPRYNFEEGFKETTKYYLKKNIV